MAEQFQLSLDFSKKDSVAEFYNKENDPNYCEKYNREHGARLDFIFHRYNFSEVYNEKLADFGGGTGYFINKFHPFNLRDIIDGANLNQNIKLKDGIVYLKQDLNKISPSLYPDHYLDKSFCFEVLEHIPCLYNLVCFIKQKTKINGEIYLSIPREDCLHNTLYAGLFYPESNFEQFLKQMALNIEDKVYSNHSFSSIIYKCINQTWDKKVLKFPKTDEKYIHASPLEVVNL